MYRMIRVLLLLLLTGVSQQASAKSRLADTTLQGGLLPGCVSLDSIRLCRKKDDTVTLLVNGRATRFFDEYFADNQTSYLLRRRHGHYEVGLGRAGTSDLAMGISDSVEFTISAKGIRLLRLFGSGFVGCNNVEEPYSYCIDLRPKNPVLEVKSFDGLRKGTYRFKQPIRNPTLKTINDYNILTYDLKVDYDKLCEPD
jgi:hypothetical protein